MKTRTLLEESKRTLHIGWRVFLVAALVSFVLLALEHLARA